MNPTIEECLELIKIKDAALRSLVDGTWAISTDTFTAGKNALELTPSSVRESIRVREELVAKMREYVISAKSELTCEEPAILWAIKMIDQALALTTSSIAETARVRVREEWVKDVLHVLESHGLEGLFVSRRRCEELIEAYRRAEWK
jgi:hypothetical protein